MVQRMKRYMNKWVSQNQSAFVGGRLIQDNIIISHEIFHCLKKRYGVSKNGYVAKIDMNKAYDRLEWDFLEHCLLAFGFSSEWIGKIMQCVKGVTYHFKINGIPTRKLFPQRGLRQGDPLSPYLFILAMESLSYMFNSADVAGRLNGLQVTPRT